MYISQVPATVLYTVLKTILLILLTQTIYSICAWMDRYDLAKIFEQGSMTIVIGSLTSQKYKKYSGMFLCLFIVICLDVVIGFLPTIATNYMPFESINFSDNIPKYFQTNFSTPIQSIPLTFNNDNMDGYCQNMELCDINKKYYKDEMYISPSINITLTKGEFKDYELFDQFIFNTNFINISISNNVIKSFNQKVNINNSDIYVNINDTSFITSYFNYDNSNPTSSLDNNEYAISKSLIENIDYSTQIFSSIINSFKSSFYYNSIINRGDIIYSDSNNHVILTLKIATNSYMNEMPYNEHEIFNNSQNLFNFVKNNITFSFNTYTTLYSIHYENNSLIKEMYQYYHLDQINKAFRIIRTKFIYSVYVIHDENFNNKLNNSMITNYNETIFSNENMSIFNNFYNKPTKDFFMYSLLSMSDRYIYGLQKETKIVTNISSIFIGIVTSIIVLFIIICGLSKYMKDKLYYNTLLETIGIPNLPIIIKENEILLKDNEK